MKHNLLLADSAEYLKNYDKEPFSLVVTDPPYLLPSWTGGGVMGEDKRDWIAQMNTDNLSRGYDIETYAKLLYKAQGGRINAYFFCNKLQIFDYFKVYVGEYGCKFDILTWHKQNAMPTFHGKYLTDTEYILYFRNKGGCDPQSYDDAKTWWVQGINQTDKAKWGHPTMKPLNIVRTLIRNSSKQNDLIFDGFLGSGTTMVAAHLENRRFIGCEIDPKFYSIAEQRYEKECFGREIIGNSKVQQLSIF